MIKVNEIVPFNIYGKNGELLICEGTFINDSIMSKLMKREWFISKPIRKLDSINRKIEKEMDKLFINNEINIEEIMGLSEEIVNIVKSNPNILENLNIIKDYDLYTYNHCNDVSFLAVTLGIKLGMSNNQLINLAIASLLHDLGKSKISNIILNKPGKLTVEEMNEMKKHCQFGYRILEKQNIVDSIVLESILFHHENYDGTGYPYGLKGDIIPMEASILHICDVYDALISKRSYKESYSLIDSMQIIKDKKETFFNPEIVDVFSKCMAIYTIDDIVEIDNGDAYIIKDYKRDEMGNIIELKVLNNKKVKVYKK